jgi:hypothetical protein
MHIPDRAGEGQEWGGFFCCGDRVRLQNGRQDAALQTARKTIQLSRKKNIRFEDAPVGRGHGCEADRGQGGCCVWNLYAASTDQAHQDHDDGNDQQDVDEAADGVGSHQAKQPENDEYNGDSVEHDFVLSV